MPKKRRKRNVFDSATDIPYPKVRVEWIDCVSDSAWATDKEFIKYQHKFLERLDKYYNDKNKAAT